MTELEGLHAVVTGGGTGIGAAIARALAGQGARLTLIGRRRDPLAKIAETIEGAVVAPADVTSREAVETAFAKGRETHGPIAILINNAGIAPSAPFAKLTAETWREMMAINLDALFHCCQAALLDLLSAKAGRVVTIASTAGLKGYGYVAPYVAAKHGAVGLMRALAAEFAATPVTFNSVCPGFTDTALTTAAIAAIRDASGRDEAEARESLVKFNPQRRLIDPAEIASAVLWLCQPNNGSVTGQALTVAGGEVT